MAQHTTADGRPIVRTLSRVDIPVDLWRRLQMLQMRRSAEAGAKLYAPGSKTINDVLIEALKEGLDLLEPAIDIHAQCAVRYVPAEALHDDGSAGSSHELKHAFGSRCKLVHGHRGDHLFEEMAKGYTAAEAAAETTAEATADTDPAPGIIDAEFEEN